MWKTPTARPFQVRQGQPLQGARVDHQQVFKEQVFKRKGLAKPQGLAKPCR
jgi:hypothetical protein